MGAVVLGGCADPSAVSSAGGQTVSIRENPTADTTSDTADTTDTEDYEDLPRAAPAFAAHFTDPVYNDEGDDFAPFGSDEGSDIVHESAERRDELGPDSTVADVIE